MECSLKTLCVLDEAAILKQSEISRPSWKQSSTEQHTKHQETFNQ